MSVTRKSFPRVGEDITVDPRIEASGKIRLRSAEAAEVARMFGLGRAVRNRKRHCTLAAEQALDLLAFRNERAVGDHVKKDSRRGLARCAERVKPLD